MEWYYHEIFGGWAVLSIFAVLTGASIAMQDDKPLAPFVLFLFVTVIAAIFASLPSIYFAIGWLLNHFLFSLFALIIVVATAKCYYRIGKRKNA